jgi:hypothetical protein
VGDNKYLADTLIDEFTVTSTLTGGDLALAYGWDDGVEVWINGLPFADADEDRAEGTENHPLFSLENDDHTRSATAIRRGSTTKVFDVPGAYVQLFDKAEITDNTPLADRVDNGNVGKIIITTENFGKITRVSASAGTVDLVLYDWNDGATREISFANVPTDDSFAVNDYVKGVVATNAAAIDPYHYRVSGTTGQLGDVLTLSAAESVTSRITSFTRRNTLDSAAVTLATVTSDGTTYTVSSLYAFGRGESPGFVNDAILYLDSHGTIIGWDGDTVSAANRDYLYVTQLDVQSVTGNSFDPVRARLAVIYGKTGTSDIVTLEIKTISGVPYAVINSTNVPLTAIDTGTEQDDYIGWYSYTINDSKVVKLGTNNSSGKAIKGDADYGTYQIGTLPPDAIGFGRDFHLSTYNPYIRADSTTVIYHNGVKYTGYTAVPAAAESFANGMLAVNNRQGFTEAVFSLGDALPATASNLYAIIQAEPIGSSYYDNRAVYSVKGSTQAISDAGAYELDATATINSYDVGDVVDIELVDGAYKIVGKRAVTQVANGLEMSLVAISTVSSVNKAVNYFTIDYGMPSIGFPHTNFYYPSQNDRNVANPGIVYTYVQENIPTTNNTPLLDVVAVNAGSTSPRTYPVIGDIVEVWSNGQGGTAAVIIWAYAGSPEAVEYAAIKAAAGNTVAAGAIGGDGPPAAGSDINYVGDVKTAIDTAVQTYLNINVGTIFSAVSTYLKTTSPAEILSVAVSDTDAEAGTGNEILAYTVQLTGQLGTTVNVTFTVTGVDIASADGFPPTA